MHPEAWMSLQVDRLVVPFLWIRTCLLVNCDSLKSLDFEYIDNKDTYAVNIDGENQRKTGKSLHISDNAEKSRFLFLKD